MTSRAGPPTCHLAAATLPLPRVGGNSVGVGDTRIALFDVRGMIHAVEDHCVQCAEPLSEGTLDGTRLTCSHCGWEYDIATGEVLRVPSIRLTKFAVCVQGSRVLIEWTMPCRADDEGALGPGRP